MLQSYFSFVSCFLIFCFLLWDVSVYFDEIVKMFCIFLFLLLFFVVCQCCILLLYTNTNTEHWIGCDSSYLTIHTWLFFNIFSILLKMFSIFCCCSVLCFNFIALCFFVLIINYRKFLLFWFLQIRLWFYEIFNKTSKMCWRIFF